MVAFDEWVIDKIFDEISETNKKCEELSKIVYTNAATLGFVNKMVIVIIIFLVTIGLTSVYEIPSKLAKEPITISSVKGNSNDSK